MGHEPSVPGVPGHAQSWPRGCSEPTHVLIQNYGGVPVVLMKPCGSAQPQPAELRVMGERNPLAKPPAFPAHMQTACAHKGDMELGHQYLLDLCY